MYIDIDGYIPVKSYDEKGIDAGSENFGFKDQKGRECGFRWRIVHYTCIPLTQAEWEAKGRCGSIRKADKPLAFFELTTSPMRDGNGYGPAFNTMETATLEEARAIIAKRAANARKRDAKKFAAFN
jgi:hypothetical protein